MLLRLIWLDVAAGAPLAGADVRTRGPSARGRQVCRAGDAAPREQRPRRARPRHLHGIYVREPQHVCRRERWRAHMRLNPARTHTLHAHAPHDFSPPARRKVALAAVVTCHSRPPLFPATRRARGAADYPGGHTPSSPRVCCGRAAGDVHGLRRMRHSECAVRIQPEAPALPCCCARLCTASPRTHRHGG